MKKVVWIVILFLIIGVSLLIYKGTYSLDEDTGVKRDLILRYEGIDDDKIINYIDMIDDVLLPISSYTMSDILSNNYDFLTAFAINYILKNSDLFRQDITIMDDYVYNNGYMNYSTNKYVNKEIIYMITSGVFNKRDYVIINDYLEVRNDMVPLLLLYNNDISMNISKAEVNRFNDNYIVNVWYENNDLVYKYIFVYDDDRLILKNLEI